MRVNAVCPGYTDTDMMASLRDEVKVQALKSVPAGRMAKPEEIADLCLYLAGESAQYINGEAIKVDGGLTA